MPLTTTSLNLGAQALNAGAGLAGGLVQASALRDQGKYLQQVQEANARLAELQAEDAVRRGEKGAQDRLREAKRLVGRQRAILAASGVDPNVGSAVDVVSDTAARGAEDAQTIRLNAMREAFGFEVEASDRRAAGRATRAGMRQEGRATAATAGLGLARDMMAGAYTYADDPYLLESSRREPRSRSGTWGIPNVMSDTARANAAFAARRARP